VTPLQMAAAVSVVANGGELMQPRAVRAVIREGTRLAVPHKMQQRVVSEKTTATMTEIMEKVVEDGTGTRAQIPGYAVAGKTGTAKKLVNGSYRGHSDYNVSFVGFVPSRKPVFTIVVVVDSPHKVSPYGGVVAAPIFQRIAAAALRQYGVPSSINAPEPVLASQWEEAGQQMASGPIESPARVAAPLPAGSSFPDLTGLGAREALAMLSRLGYTARLQGAGLVVDQWPGPGSALDPSETVVLRLARRPPERMANAGLR